MLLLMLQIILIDLILYLIITDLIIILTQLEARFAIPAVGAHVWVFFRDGNPQFPVYFAASFGQI